MYWKWRHDKFWYDTWFACVWIHNRECCQFLGDDGLSLRMLFSRVAPFGVLWTLTSYLYLQGLRRIPATDACALFCCSRAFVFLISWIVLRDRFMGVRVSLWYINRIIKTCNYVLLLCAVLINSIIDFLLFIIMHFVLSDHRLWPPF